MQHYKRPSDSDTTLTELMIPSYANFGGKIHGGILLSLMDKVAYACATKHAENYCVTVAVENVDFLQPVEVGDLVSLLARVNYTGRTSLVVGIKVTAENVKQRVVKHTNTSYFTMVAKDENDKPTAVPGLLLTSEEDIRRFAESILRKDLKDYHRKYMREKRAEFSIEEEMTELEKYNCRIEL
ncbi:MAG TPA: acyl-CoA thioesterase [Flammeovirgaceae bacterium]|nr:acyl-CoA thioesterase [Flammeovirgaceae bacterium]